MAYLTKGSLATGHFLGLGLHDPVIIMNSFNIYFFSKRFSWEYPEFTKRYLTTISSTVCCSPLHILAQRLGSKEQRKEGKGGQAELPQPSHFQFWVYEIAAKQNQASLTCRFFKDLHSQGENGKARSISWKCEVVCDNFSAQPCCFHQGVEWPGDALLLQCS